MIDAKEIRIGNWVMRNDLPFPFRVEAIFTNPELKTWITIYSEYWGRDKREEKELMPIELNDKQIMDKIFPSDFSFDQLKRDQKLIESWIVKYKIKFVHQLQNFVFVVKGEDMRIDLENPKSILKGEDETEE